MTHFILKFKFEDTEKMKSTCGINPFNIKPEDKT